MKLQVTIDGEVVHEASGSHIRAILTGRECLTKCGTTHIDESGSPNGRVERSFPVSATITEHFEIEVIP